MTQLIYLFSIHPLTIHFLTYQHTSSYKPPLNLPAHTPSQPARNTPSLPPSQSSLPTLHPNPPVLHPLIQVVWESTIEISESLVQGNPPTLPPTLPRRDSSGSESGNGGCDGDSSGGDSSGGCGSGGSGSGVSDGDNCSGASSHNELPSSSLPSPLPLPLPSMELHWDAFSLWPVAAGLISITDAEGAPPPPPPSLNAR